ncbi:MAG TPA: hypothetical protein VIS74_06730 [Chthoniobacterales bacterium]
MRPLLCGLLSALLLSAAHAQTPKDAKNRFVFDPGATTPQTPAPPPAPALTPPQTLESFFNLLKQEKISPAYDGLVAGTILGERKEDVEALKNKTQQAIDSYGSLSGYEIIDTLTAGKNLLRYTCISLNEDLPLRWRFYFYNGPKGWRLVDLRIDDGLVELFESIKQRNPPAP